MSASQINDEGFRRSCGSENTSRAACRTNILGTGISAINLTMAIEIIDAWVRKKEQNYICVTGVHGVMESYRDDELRAVHNRAGLVTPDGMPMVWLSKLNGFRHVRRVYGPDLMLAVCKQGIPHGYRHFFYGGASGVANLLAKRLSIRFPGLEVAGSYCPPFRQLADAEDAKIVGIINDSAADIVWVGLSTPKQEHWMAAHVGHVRPPVLIGVGAAFDFHAGVKAQAPYWMQQSGLEWLFRMVTEPRRLGMRYMVNNPAFVFLMAQQLMGLKQYSMEVEFLQHVEPL